jgi:hypothetical protein
MSSTGFLQSKSKYFSGPVVLGFPIVSSHVLTHTHLHSSACIAGVSSREPTGLKSWDVVPILAALQFFGRKWVRSGIPLSIFRLYVVLLNESQ